MLNTEGFEFSDELKLLRQTAQQFAQKEIAPLAEEIDTTNTFPHALWKKMGEMGFLGITVPTEYGGVDLGYFAHIIVMEEISRASAAIGLSYGAHSNLCVNQLVLNGTPTQKQSFLPKLVSGEHVGALAMSETEAGSDVMGMQLKATPVTGGFKLNGTKMWITNGPDADIIIVYAKTDPSAKSKGVSAFIIEKSFAGFKSAQKLNKLGMRGSNTSELVFQDCFVPESHLLGTLHGGAKVLMRGLNYERLILAAGPVGIMQACLDIVVPYIQTRKQFGKALGEFQLMQAKLADLYTATLTSRAYLYQFAKIADQGKLTNQDAASVILYCAEQATQCALQAIQCLGGNGYIQDYPTGRLLRDAKLYEIGAGTSEIRRLIIGKALYQQGI